MNITYTLRITYRDGTHHTHDYREAQQAWAKFRAAASPSGFDLYARVELIEFNAEEQQDCPNLRAESCACPHLRAGGASRPVADKAHHG